MWTGRQTLTSIENAITKLHQDEGQLDTALKSATADGERLRKERVEAFRELARIKLDDIEAGRLVNDLDAAERRAIQILGERRERIADALRTREEAVRAVTDAQRVRDAAAQAVESALAAVEALRADVEARVQATAEWQAAKAPVDEAEKIASEAENKAANSEAELGSKKKPYDHDPLFTYLWMRGYGTARYSATWPVTYVDRKLADFISYAGARANYVMLTEIPLRLREHANTQRAIVDEHKTRLSEVERRAMVAAGIEPREKALSEARERLALADRDLQSKQDALKAADARRAKVLGTGNDPAYEEALATVALADSKDDIVTLYREARRTAATVDEAIVRKIEILDQSISKIDAEIADLRRSVQDLARRRIEIEKVRDRFRDAGYDHPHTTFGNDSQLGTVLGQMIEGVVRSGILWDLLRSSYGYRPPRGSPDFGSPNLPFPFPIPGGGSSGPIGGGWREPQSRGSWSPSDDRFTTGGSF